MIWFLLSLYVAGCAGIVVFGKPLRRNCLWVAAVPMAATAVWSATRLGSDSVVTAGFDWVPDLDVSIVLRVDALSALLSLMVAGIGALVCVYAIGYFSPTAAGMPRFAATLLAFSGAMVGLVWADSVWTLFGFWELTSITSFLLVGFKHVDPVARTAARRALVITAAGGLALLAGFVLFVDAAGTAILSDITPVTGSTATAAAVLILIAAATKSAQVPFHVWLPGAMAAPTPVSAYLHSATMVKAGVILVAVIAPAFRDTDVWKPLGLTFGLVTMIWGAVGALRHVDAKLILAWGTVSQLGLLVSLLAIGTPKATFAALSIMIAHAVFKAALFMVVGEVDVRTGTRNINELSGLRRTMPLTFVVAVVSAASMAGIPPLLGFPAKEAAIEAVLGLSGTERLVVGGLVIGGAVLTVAYTTRLLIGMFGKSAPMPDRAVSPVRPAMSAPEVILGVGSLAGFVALGWMSEVVRSAAVIVAPKAEVYSLHRWPGLTDAFVTSMIVVVAGLVVGVVLARRSVPAGPAARGAAIVDALVDSIGRGARHVAAVVQHGSLPLYLATTVVVLAAASAPFVLDIDTSSLYWANNWVEGVVVVMIVAAALASTVVRSRLGAAMVLGAVGFSVAGLFVNLGAPDLVLTQLLVETVVVVGFVVGLGRLATKFPRATRLWLSGRIVLSVLIGTAIAAGLAAGAARPSGEPPVLDLADAAVEDGGGNNVVNVILTDTRGLDTVGEAIVLMVVAVGILTLTTRRRAGAYGVRRVIARTSPIVRLSVQAATPIALLIAVYVLFVGHNAPGGGFAAGLMLGAVIVLRTVAGIQQPRYAYVMLSVGGMIVAGEALAPMLWGQPLLDQVTASWDVPVLGKVKVGSALVFDIGVLLVVTGLITALLDGFDATSLVDRGLRPDPGRDAGPAVPNADHLDDHLADHLADPVTDGDARADGGPRT